MTGSASQTIDVLNAAIEKRALMVQQLEHELTAARAALGTMDLLDMRMLAEEGDADAKRFLEDEGVKHAIYKQAEAKLRDACDYLRALQTRREELLVVGRQSETPVDTGSEDNLVIDENTEKPKPATRKREVTEEDVVFLPSEDDDTERKKHKEGEDNEDGFADKVDWQDDNPTPTPSFDLPSALRQVMVEHGPKAVLWLNAAPLCFDGLSPPDECFSLSCDDLPGAKTQLAAVRERIASEIRQLRPDFVAAFPSSAGWTFLSEMAPSAQLFNALDIDEDICRKFCEALIALLENHHSENPEHAFWLFSRGCVGLARKCPFPAQAVNSLHATQVDMGLPKGMELSAVARDLFDFVEQQPWPYVITVKVPQDEERLPFEPGTIFKARIVRAVEQCNGFVVEPLNNGHKTMVLVPRAYIVEKDVLPPEVNTKASFRAQDDTMNTTTRKRVGGEWFRAMVLHELGNDHVLLQLRDFRPTDWFGSYDVCRVDSEQFSRDKNGKEDPQAKRPRRRSNKK